ncbi:MAG: hypothetical protein ACYC8T_30470, partial [Myxococcaceae bacterium]
MRFKDDGSVEWSLAVHAPAGQIQLVAGPEESSVYASLLTGSFTSNESGQADLVLVRAGTEVWRRPFPGMVATAREKDGALRGVWSAGGRTNTVRLDASGTELLRDLAPPPSTAAPEIRVQSIGILSDGDLVLASSGGNIRGGYGRLSGTTIATERWFAGKGSVLNAFNGVLVGPSDAIFVFGAIDKAIASGYVFAGYDDAFVLRADPATGNQRWAAQVGSPDWDVVVDAVVDPAGSVWALFVVPGLTNEIRKIEGSSGQFTSLGQTPRTCTGPIAFGGTYGAPCTPGSYGPMYRCAVVSGVSYVVRCDSNTCT